MAMILKLVTHKGFHKASEASSDSLGQYNFLEVVAKAKGLVADVQSSEDSLRLRREARLWRRRGQNVQKFAAAVKDFLTAFHGIVAFLAQTDSQFANVGCAAISALLDIGQNQQVQEDIITSTIDSSTRLLHELPRIQDNFREDDDIVSRCRDICLVIEGFMEESVKYYRRSTWHRLWTAIVKPPQNHTQRFLDRLKELVIELMQYHEIRHCEMNKKTREEIESLNGRIADLNTQVEHLTTQVEDLHEQGDDLTIEVENLNVEVGDLNSQVEGLNARIEDLSTQVTSLCARLERSRQAKAGDRGAEITRSLLLPVDWKFENMQRRCIDSRERIPRYVRKTGNRCYPRPLQQASLAMLQALPQYQDWENDPHSSNLILQGQNGASNLPSCRAN